MTTPTTARRLLPLWPRRRPGGRILAIKWGYNPNSSSLGVDVTFLLFSLSLITLFTPLIGLLLRYSARGGRSPSPAPHPSSL
jgi:hypothetical protein